MAERGAVSNRITASRCLLVNWSRFQKEIFRMSGSTLLTGLNGTGKSTVLDAMSYLLTGNRRFNMAAKDKDRSVRTYVRGDTNSNGADRYLRTGEVTSYIAMEFYTPVEKLYFVVGVCIESPGETDQTSSRWFIVRDAQLSDIHFWDEDREAGTYTVVPRSRLTVRGTRLKSSDFLTMTTGIPQILRALGLRLSANFTYQRYASKLTKMMAFNPENNIDQFIQDSVLEDSPVDTLKEIREYREQYNKIRQVYDDLLEGRDQLQVIENTAADYEIHARNLAVRELMLVYQDWQQALADKKDAERVINRLQVEKLALEGQTEEYKRRRDEAERRREKANSNQILTDKRATLDDLERQITELENDLVRQNNYIKELGQLSDQIRATQEWKQYRVSIIPEDSSIFEHLTDASQDEATRIEAFDRFAAQVYRTRDVVSTDLVHVKDEQRKEKEILDQLLDEKRRLDSNQIIYDKRAEQARDLVSAELKKQGINTEVFLFAELVKDVRDKSWSKAIETFLGRKRFYLIVDGRYCRDVMRILQDKKIYDMHAVITDQLPEELDHTEHGSAADQLEISHVYARRYANYLLNGIWLCRDLEELHSHPKGGLMKNGMLAKSYAASLMTMTKTRICLGRDAIDRQKEQTARQIRESEEKIAGLTKQIAPLESIGRYIDWINLHQEAYHFGAAAKKAREEKEVRDKKLTKDKILNTPELMAAMQEQTDAQEAYRAADEAYISHTGRISACVKQMESAEEKEKRCAEEEQAQQDAYQDYLASHDPSLEKQMLKDYIYNSQRSHSVIAIQRKSVDKMRTDLVLEARGLEDKQWKYLQIINRLDRTLLGPGQIPFYRGEYRQVRNVKIDEARQQLQNKSEQLEQAFMNDFVAELKEKMDQAQDDIDGINRELAHTPFGQDTYIFTRKRRADRESFFRIADKIEEYRGAMDMMRVMEQGNTQFSNDVQEFIDMILSDDDDSEYTDYRRYFTYDMTIRSRQGSRNVEAELSRKQGSASGGEKQTPYFIILAASLMQCYPRENCCERLAFIDEAFSALSRERIEQMVKYLEENHFQVIYAAPPEKIDSIGSHIDTVVSLIPHDRYTFAIEGLTEMQ